MSTDPQTVRETPAPRPTVVERYRKHLDSPYGRELHDLAEVDVLACELRELVALAEKGARVPDEPLHGERDAGVPDDPWWPFTGGADVCYGEHDDANGVYRECCMRAGLAYALKLREQQLRASVTAKLAEQDGDVRAEKPGRGFLAQAYANGWHDAIAAYRAPGWAEREAGWKKYIAEVDVESAPQQPERGGEA